MTFKLKPEPKMPIREICCETMEVDEGYSLQSFIDWAQSFNVPYDTVKVCIDYWEHDSRSIYFGLQYSETDEAFAKRMQQYNEDMKVYKKYLEDHKQEIEDYHKRVAAKSIKTQETKKKKIEAEIKRLQKQLKKVK